MMDTSETFIKMADCEEIQGNKRDSYHPPQNGDWWIHTPTGSISVCDSHYNYMFSPDFIWLPRQDQIQEMIGKTLHLLYREFFYFASSVAELSGILNDEKFTSMEQLWLAFYMKEKHNKVWDGEHWIEAK